MVDAMRGAAMGAGGGSLVPVGGNALGVDDTVVDVVDGVVEGDRQSAKRQTGIAMFIAGLGAFVVGWTQEQLSENLRMGLIILGIGFAVYGIQVFVEGREG